MQGVPENSTPGKRNFFWDRLKRYLLYYLQFQLLNILSFLKNFKLRKYDIPDWSYSMSCTTDEISMFFKQKSLTDQF